LRHACCVMLEDACSHEGGAADACCAERESGRNANHEALVKANGSIALAASTLSMVHAALAPASHSVVPHSIAGTLHADIPLYLRHASLRI
jgi:hypothetical protein